MATSLCLARQSANARRAAPRTAPAGPGALADACLRAAAEATGHVTYAKSETHAADGRDEARRVGRRRHECAAEPHAAESVASDSGASACADASEMITLDSMLSVSRSVMSQERTSEAWMDSRRSCACHSGPAAAAAVAM